MRCLLALIGMSSALAFSAPSWAQAPDPAARAAVELPASTGQLGRLHVAKSGRIIENTMPRPDLTPPPDPRAPVLEGSPPVCNVLASHTAASFTGGTYTLQAGFGEGEIAAAQYVVPASAFPIKLDLLEMIFGTQNAVVQTTTQYTIFVWSGNPATGTQVFSFSSDGDLLPHIVVGPGTAGVNLNFSIDPTDPDQIIINDDGTHTFSVGVRIDRHNSQTANPCFTAPPANRNAFPATDNTQSPAPCALYPELQQPTRNWLFGLNCGSDGCPSNGGWSTFQNLRVDQNVLGFCLPGCRPHGDWVMRATWSSLACTPGFGACCHPDGTCTFGAQADCNTANGVYQGDNTSCANVTCPQPTGACCFGNNSCIVLSAANCTVAGGTYLGDDTTCAPNSACPLGACCLPSGACVSVTQQQCTAQSGTFRGVGTSCASANCPPPSGACCLSNGGCLRITPAQCSTIGGTYLGDGVNCGANSTCPTGACCLADGVCSLKNSVDCAALGGTFRGVGTSCATANCPQPSGACCLANGNCLVLARSDCLLIPGSSFAGANTACSACAPACPADFNHDGTLDPDDLADFIAAYFASPPGPGTDFNADSNVDPDDLADFITAYFAGC